VSTLLIHAMLEGTHGPWALWKSIWLGVPQCFESWTSLTSHQIRFAPLTFWRVLCTAYRQTCTADALFLYGILCCFLCVRINSDFQEVKTIRFDCLCRLVCRIRKSMPLATSRPDTLSCFPRTPQGFPLLATLFKLSNRFKSDRDEIWQDCSSSKYASTDRVRFSIYALQFQDGGHDVISGRKVLPSAEYMPAASNSVYSPWSTNLCHIFCIA